MFAHSSFESDVSFVFPAAFNSLDINSYKLSISPPTPRSVSSNLGNIDRAEPRTDQRPPSLERMLDILDRSSTILDVDRQI